MFGRQGVIPSIYDGNLASMEPISESDVILNDFYNWQKSEELYRRIDVNERLQMTNDYFLVIWFEPTMK